MHEGPYQTQRKGGNGTGDAHENGREFGHDVGLDADEYVGSDRWVRDCFEDCYTAIRERIAKGGPGWPR